MARFLEHLVVRAHVGTFSPRSRGDSIPRVSSRGVERLEQGKAYQDHTGLDIGRIDLRCLDFSGRDISATVSLVSSDAVFNRSAP